MLQWPGQVVIAGCQTHWTKEVSEALIENKIDELYKALMAQVSKVTPANDSRVWPLFSCS